MKIDLEALRKRDKFLSQVEQEAKEHNLQYTKDGFTMDIPDIDIEFLLNQKENNNENHES